MSSMKMNNQIKCEWLDGPYKCNLNGYKEYQGSSLCDEHYVETRQYNVPSPFEQAVEFHKEYICVGNYVDGYYDNLPNTIYLYIKKERLPTIEQFKNIKNEKDLKSLGMLDIDYDEEISINDPIWIYCDAFGETLD
jgi:hypothetical protein